MKKLITCIGLGLALVSASAQNFVAKNFINGWNLIVSNNTTINFGNLNAVWADSVGNLRWGLNTNYIPATFYQGSTLTTVAGQPDAIYWTNTAVLGSTAGIAWSDLPNQWIDRNGKQTDNVTVYGQIRGLDAGATNGLTFTLASLEPTPNTPLNASLSTSNLVNNGSVLGKVNTQSGRFTFFVLPTGTTAITFKTNPPAAFLQGAGGFRLVSVVSQSGGSGTLSNIIVDALGIEGFAP